MKFIKRKNINTYDPKSTRFSVEVDGRAIIGTTNSLTIPVGTMAQRPGNAGTGPVTVGMIRYCTDLTGGADLEIYTGRSVGSYGSVYLGDSGWEKLRTSRAANITVSNVGTGQGDGTLTSIQIDNAGTGYSVAPTITISAPDIGANRATAHATVSGGVIQSIVIDNYGTGYVSVPTVTITPVSGGVNAHATAILTGTLTYDLPYVPYDYAGAVSTNNVAIYVENVYQIPGVNYTVTLSGNTAKLNFDAPVPLNKPIYAIYGFDH